MSPKGAWEVQGRFFDGFGVSFGGLRASFFDKDHALDRDFSIDSFGMVLWSVFCWFVVVSGDPVTWKTMQNHGTVVKNQGLTKAGIRWVQEVSRTDF